MKTLIFLLFSFSALAQSGGVAPSLMVALSNNGQYYGMRYGIDFRWYNITKKHNEIFYGVSYANGDGEHYNADYGKINIGYKKSIIPSLKAGLSTSAIYSRYYPYGDTNVNGWSWGLSPIISYEINFWFYVETGMTFNLYEQVNNGTTNYLTIGMRWPSY